MNRNPAPQPANEPETLAIFKRVLQAERARGCDDRTVIGGLDALARNLALRTDVAPGSPLSRVLIELRERSYGRLSPDQRRQRIDAWLVALSRPPAATRPRGERPVTWPNDAQSTGRAAAAAALPVAQPRVAPDSTTRVAPDSPARAPRALPKARQLSNGLSSLVTELPGVGANRAEVLSRLDILTVRDLLFHFPHRHDDFSRILPVSELQEGEQATVVARVWSAAQVQLGRAPRKSSELIVGDETGNLRVIFFNNPYPAQQVRTNQRLTLSGRVTAYRGQRQLENPEWEIVEEGGDLEAAIHTGRLVPVYPLTQGIQNRALRKHVRTALDLYGNLLEDHLPAEVVARHGFPDLATAVRQAHYPDDAESLERARRRLAYDELLTLQSSVLLRRAQRQRSASALPLPFDERLLDGFIASLPFALTQGQRYAANDLLADLRRETPMARLLQGDVGSGKTVVAAIAMLAAVVNGLQAVLMAPTEILADQHFRTLCRLLGEGAEPADEAAMFSCRPSWLGRPIGIALLRGGLRASVKRQVQEAIAAGEVDIAVGTQALIQTGISFDRLAVTVVDEQHRFGVQQRSTLAEKGENTHLLVMTATPIPRTLALSLYGDLDLSLIDELPPGRKPVITRVVEPERRDHAYTFVRQQIEHGHQAFIICPLVEESEALEVRAATDEYERLRSEVFPDLQVSLLHGRMAPAEKDAVMRAFRDWESSILVSTAVVEVGIDVPRANVILIEDADRFGLAQLHQFRGRVGRGGQQSYCLLLSESQSVAAQQRLKLLERTNNGLELAEADLRLRGPGDYFGTRQSGLPTLRLARLGDTQILEAAREDASAMVAHDPQLSAPEHAGLRRRIVELLARAGEAN